MKPAILSLLLAAAGVGTLGLRSNDAADSETCPASDCRVEVKCTPRGTCLVTCYEDDGSIRCQKEIECDEPCAEPKDCSSPCAPEKSCSK
jgi:hypothetical protein